MVGNRELSENYSSDLRMVDVSGKKRMYRKARASGTIVLQPNTIQRIKEGALEKGDIITTSKLAGISAAKKTPDLLPLCHPLSLTKISVDLEVMEDKIVVTSEVIARERTGVEMEALVAVAVALLNIWDMTKMYEKDEHGQYPYTNIKDIRVIEKIKEDD
ncbi:MAG: cyclic pyranopterin monophosphate synthase MoaC [Promethearchaeota archaeon]